MRDLADAMKVPPQATQAIIGISMRGSLVRGNRLFADQRQEEIRATRAPASVVPGTSFTRLA